MRKDNQKSPTSNQVSGQSLHKTAQLRHIVSEQKKKVFFVI